MGKVKSFAVLQEDKTYGTPVPLSVDLENVDVSTELAAKLQEKGIDIAQSNIDYVLMALIDVLASKVSVNSDGVVPVNQGGTGVSSIGLNKVLVGDSNGNLVEKAIDTTATSGSTNLISSNAVAKGLLEKANTNHASSSSIYGLATEDKYGHLRIVDDYSKLIEEEGVGISQKGIYNLYSELVGKINQEITFVSDSQINITYADGKTEQIIFSESQIVDTLFDSEGQQLEKTTTVFDSNGNIQIIEE
jgi:hypothetical protein